MLITNANAFLNNHFVPGTQLLVRNGQIADIGSSVAAPGEEIIDLQGDFLLPGFVDVHIHAFMGSDTMSGEAAVRHMSRELLKLGVAAFLPTTMSASPTDTQKALQGIQAVMKNPEPHGALVMGAHMEAPFLQPSKAGAQDQTFFAAPTQENWKQYVGEYEEIVNRVTLAPELEGAMAFIHSLAERGIAVSLGHTNATAEQTHEAAENGARCLTHTFNAQSPLSHRAPGVPGAALVDDRLACELICDGIHLHPDILRLVVRCKGSRLVLAVTDAMEAAGMPDGQYQLGGQNVFVKDGAARLQNGTLAGSTLTMPQALQNLISFGIAPEDAAHMTTKTPAIAIGSNLLGDLSVVGAPAVFARFAPDWSFVGALV